MIARPLHMLVRTASALAVVLAIAGCTQGGQFDPTEVLAADPFGTKKKLQGEREPLFPSGVPGAETRRAARSGQGLPAAAGADGGGDRRYHQTAGRGGRGKAETKTETQAEGRARTRGSTGGAGPRLGPEFGGSAAAAARPGLGSEIRVSAAVGLAGSAVRRLRPSKRRSQRNRSGPILRRPIRLRVDHFG